ncbi:MAG: hypothetical protein K9N51_08565 [Candidatus Pacebacteria bacterium]|nr:hypothetical protein [Candidatus Paceibacterota bacterium]
MSTSSRNGKERKRIMGNMQERVLGITVFISVLTLTLPGWSALVNEISLSGFDSQAGTPSVIVDGVSQTPTITGIADITNNTSPTHTWNVQLSNLDLNGVGGNDDTLAFTFTLSGTQAGSPHNITELQAGSSGNYYIGIVNGQMRNINEVVTMTISNMQRGLDGTSPVAAPWSGGVSGLETYVVADGNFINVNGGFYYPVPNTSPDVFGPFAPLAASTVFTSGNDGYGIHSWDIQLTIPEPASLTLLSLGGLVLLRRSRIRKA